MAKANRKFRRLQDDDTGSSKTIALLGAGALVGAGIVLALEHGKELSAYLGEKATHKDTVYDEKQIEKEKEQERLRSYGNESKRAQQLILRECNGKSEMINIGGEDGPITYRKGFQLYELGIVLAASQSAVVRAAGADLNATARILTQGETQNFGPLNVTLEKTDYNVDRPPKEQRADLIVRCDPPAPDISKLPGYLESEKRRLEACGQISEEKGWVPLKTTPADRRMPHPENKSDLIEIGPGLYPPDVYQTSDWKTKIENGTHRVAVNVTTSKAFLDWLNDPSTQGTPYSYYNNLGVWERGFILNEKGDVELSWIYGRNAPITDCDTYEKEQHVFDLKTPGKKKLLLQFTRGIYDIDPSIVKSEYYRSGVIARHEEDFEIPP